MNRCKYCKQFEKELLPQLINYCRKKDLRFYIVVRELNPELIPKRIKTVNVGFILIFLNEYVGTLLINRIDTATIKYGVIIAKFKNFVKSDNSNIIGKRIKHPPAGDGMP